MREVVTILAQALSQIMAWQVPALGVTYLELFGAVAFLVITVKFLKRVFGTEVDK